MHVVGEIAYADAETHNKLRAKNAEQMSELMKYLSEDATDHSSVYADVILK